MFTTSSQPFYPETGSKDDFYTDFSVNWSLLARVAYLQHINIEMLNMSQSQYIIKFLIQISVI